MIVGANFFYQKISFYVNPIDQLTLPPHADKVKCPLNFSTILRRPDAHV